MGGLLLDWRRPRDVAGGWWITHRKELGSDPANLYRCFYVNTGGFKEFKHFETDRKAVYCFINFVPTLWKPQRRTGEVAIGSNVQRENVWNEPSVLCWAKCFLFLLDFQLRVVLVSFVGLWLQVSVFPVNRLGILGLKITADLTLTKLEEAALRWVLVTKGRIVSQPSFPFGCFLSHCVSLSSRMTNPSGEYWRGCLRKWEGDL